MEDTTEGITPGIKADGTPKTVLNMAFYDDVETLMDQIMLHYSADLDAAGIERAIREEFEVRNGDLRPLIKENIVFCEQRGITPASIRQSLNAKHFWLHMLWEWLKQLWRPCLVGAIAGALGTLLFSHFVYERIPPALGSLRYLLLVLVIMGAYFTVRRIHRTYHTSYSRLAIASIGGAVGALLLLALCA